MSRAATDVPDAAARGCRVPARAPVDRDAADRAAPAAAASIRRGPSRLTSGPVPYGVELAAAWSWRILVIVAAAALLGWLISFFAVVVIPVVVALLIAALVVPVVEWLTGIGVRRSLAAILVVVTTIASVGALLTFAGQQVATGATDLADQTVAGPAGDQGLAQGRSAERQRLPDQRLHRQRPGRDHRPVQGRRRRRAGSPRSAPRSGTCWPASSSCCSRRTSSSPTAAASGPGWCGCRRGPRASGSTARAGSPGSR